MTAAHLDPHAMQNHSQLARHFNDGASMSPCLRKPVSRPSARTVGHFVS